MLRVRGLVPAVVLAAIAVACEPSEPAAAPPTLARLADFEGCVPWNGQPIDRVCVPRGVREGAPLSLEIAGSASCGSTIERCSVTVEGRDVTLSLDGRTCTGAAADCARGTKRVVCRVPPLGPGRYRVRYDDATGRSDVLDVVSDPRAATTCGLGDPA